MVPKNLHTTWNSAIIDKITVLKIIIFPTLNHLFNYHYTTNKYKKLLNSKRNFSLMDNGHTKDYEEGKVKMINL